MEQRHHATHRFLFGTSWSLPWSCSRPSIRCVSFDLEPDDDAVATPLTAEPLRYEQLAEKIATAIREDGLRPGARLPAERELRLTFGVSRGTVRRALNELRSRQLVEPAARGWIVVEPSLGEPDALLSFSEMVERTGIEASSTVLARRTRTASAEERDQLQLISDTAEVFELTRLRTVDGTPLGIEVSRLPADLAPFTETDFAEESLYSFLRRRGRRPSKSDYVVQAAIASDFEASLLEDRPGAPLLVTTAVTFDQRDVPIELSHSSFRADRYKFHATLRAAQAPPFQSTDLGETP